MENQSLSRQVGVNVRRLRKERKLSLAEVSSRMTALRVPLSLNTLSKVELGTRDLSLDELVALAAALGVAPVLLIFPLGHQRSVELFPGDRLDTWAATRWFTGEASPPAIELITWSDLDETVDDWATSQFRDQDRLLEEWRWIRRTLAAGDDIDSMHAAARGVEARLSRHRTAMRRQGIDPGPLPEGLAHIEGGDDGER